MDINTSQMTIKTQTNEQRNTTQTTNSTESFSEELKEMQKTSDTELQKNNCEQQDDTTTKNNTEEQNINNALDNLNSVVKEVNNKNDIHQLNEKNQVPMQNNAISDDINKKEEIDLINNNDCNIKENQDTVRKMDLNMNFSSNGQEFSSFMHNKDAENKVHATLGNSKKDLEEEAAILSTMEENIEIANKNNEIRNRQKTEKPTEKVQNDNIYIRNDVVIEKVVQSDSILMTKDDVNMFIDIVNGKEINLNTLTSEAAEKSLNVSKTLLNMLAKTRENNQPLRIDFDNDISVIIKISREGKLSADFLPSSQIAETYLKENLPLLKQRFEENDIPYDELNQRERRNKERENEQRKDKKDE